MTVPQTIIPLKLYFTVRKPSKVSHLSSINAYIQVYNRIYSGFEAYFSKPWLLAHPAINKIFHLFTPGSHPLNTDHPIAPFPILVTLHELLHLHAHHHIYRHPFQTIVLTVTLTLLFTTTMSCHNSQCPLQIPQCPTPLRLNTMRETKLLLPCSLAVSRKCFY